MMHTLSAIPRALVLPDRAFAEERVYNVPKWLILIIIFILSIIGQRLEVGYNENAHAKQLQLLEANARLDSLMQSAPPQAQAQARRQVVDSILGPQNAVFTSIGMVMRTLFFLVLLVEVWLLCTVVSQFFGGQEDRHTHTRPSLTLVLVSFIPLAIRSLLQGIVLSFKNPDAAANALTMADYQAVSAVRFDLFSLLPLHGIPQFIAWLLRLATDPFFLWTLAIMTFGGKAVFRLSLKGALAQSALLIVILSLQAALLSRIGITMEI
jgi:hypothetical protein